MIVKAGRPARPLGTPCRRRSYSHGSRRIVRRPVFESAQIAGRRRDFHGGFDACLPATTQAPVHTSWGGRSIRTRRRGANAGPRSA